MLIYKKRLVRDRYQLLILQTPFNAVLHLFKATYIEIWCFVKRIQGRKTCLFFIQKVCVCSHYQSSIASTTTKVYSKSFYLNIHLHTPITKVFVANLMHMVNLQKNEIFVHNI